VQALDAHGAMKAISRAERPQCLHVTVHYSVEQRVASTTCNEAKVARNYRLDEQPGTKVEWSERRRSLLESILAIPKYSSADKQYEYPGGTP
jgi:hypothetical protein